METKGEPTQPSFLDSKNRPKSDVVSHNIDLELEARFPMQEQRDRIREQMRTGMSISEAEKALKEEDSTDYKSDYGSKK